MILAALIIFGLLCMAFGAMIFWPLPDNHDRNCFDYNRGIKCDCPRR